MEVSFNSVGDPNNSGKPLIYCKLQTNFITYMLSNRHGHCHTHYDITEILLNMALIIIQPTIIVILAVIFFF